MISRSIAFCQLALAVVFFHASGVHADCVDTVGLSAQERDFHLRANAVLKSFLRRAPEGENIRSSDQVADPAHIQACKGEKKPGDFTVAVSRKYIWPDPKKHSADTAITLSIAINVRSFGAPDGNFSGAYGSPSPARSAGLTVNNVEWKLSDAGYGVPAQRNALRASLAAVMERERLAALVGRPLPGVAESDAIAKKAGPTPMIAPEPAVRAGSTATPASASPAAEPAASSSAPAPAADVMKDAADAVQKLRGLFGR